MADENTILLDYVLHGDQVAIDFGSQLKANLDAQALAAKALGEAFNIESSQIKKNEECVYSLNNIIKTANQLRKEEEQALKALNAENERHIVTLSKEDAETNKLIQKNLAAKDKERATTLKTLNAENERYNAELSHQDAELEKIRQKDISNQEKQRLSVLKTLATENDRYNASLSRENAEMAKVAARTKELNSTSLGRWISEIHGGAKGVEKLEKNVYQATRQAMLLSQSLVTHPIRTLKAFAASTEKAARASAYLKEQLAFVAASRFGTIMIGFAIFGTAAKLIRDAAKAQIDLDTATQYVSSAFIDVSMTAKTYSEIQNRLISGAVQFGQKYEEVAKILWELKSAGLSVTETFAAQETVQKLIITGATDFNMTARMTAGLYRAFGQEIKGASTEQEKFAEIGGSVAYVLAKSQANLDDLMQSYKYATGVAKATGMSFNELNAALLVANNRLLFGSTAGTGFAQALLNIAKNWRQFAKDFDIAIDPNKTLNYIDFIKQLAKNQDLVNSKIGAMGKLSEDSNVRALRILLAHTQGVEELDRVYEELTKGGLAKYLDEQSGKRMDTLIKQWDRFKESMKANAIALDVWVTGAKIVLKGMSDLTEAHRRITEAEEKRGQASLAALLNSMYFIATLKILGKSNKEILEISKNIEAFANHSDKASTAVAKITQNTKELKLYASFKELLDDEEKYRLGLSEQGDFLKAQLLTLEKILIKKEKEAVDQANINIASEEYEKAKQETITVIEKINANLEKQRQIERSNLDAIKDYIDKIGTLKTLDPAEQMQANLIAFEMAQSRLLAAKEGTEEWRKALKDVGDTTVKVANNIKIAEDASKKAAKSFQDMVSASLDVLKTPGADPYSTQHQLEQLKEQLGWKVLTAEKTEDELDALKQQQALIQQMNQAGLTDWRMQQESVSIAQRIVELTQRKADEDARKATEAAKVLKTTDITKDRFAEINKETGKLSLSLQDVYDALDKGLNSGLDVTKQKITEIITKVTELATTIKEMPEINLESLVGSTQPIGLTLADILGDYRGAV